MYRPVAYIASLLLALPPLLAHAQNPPTPMPTSTASSSPLYQNIGDVACALTDIFTVIFTGAMIISAFIVLIAGIRYITGQGDSKKVGEVHQTLLWAAIGVAVALFAKGFPFLIATIVGATITAPAC